MSIHNVRDGYNVYEEAVTRTPEGWEDLFSSCEDELRDIDTALSKRIREKKIFPNVEDVFMAYHYTPLWNVKVVILGQDPYHQLMYKDGLPIPRAMGLSFSIRPEDHNIPVSLVNIYKELARSVEGFKIPDNGCLIEWADQGVFLLNAGLTVPQGEPEKHLTIWTDFITATLKAVMKANPYVIFVAWGTKSKAVISRVADNSKCHILETSHPSGYSVNRGFNGCNHFNEINRILIKQGDTSIDWRITNLQN